jgi:hypothetical protein
LRDAVAKGDHPTALRLHEAILRFWNAAELYNLPASSDTPKSRV